VSDRQIVFTGLLIGMALYTPVNIYVFDGSLATMLDRAYFMFGGAAIAMYAPRGRVGSPKQP
jgi:hypothetical protein